MLDKSVPFVDILMHRPAGTPLVLPPLPDGYAFRFYRPGDEKSWAKIETAVLEFPSAWAARRRFRKLFGDRREALPLRCVFIENPEGEKVATATAWSVTLGGLETPWLSSVGVMSAWQGQGLGKAIIGEALATVLRLDGDRDVWLHTQTWSHRAVGIYEGMGFYISRRDDLPGYKNNRVDDAIRILAEVRKGD